MSTKSWLFDPRHGLTAGTKSLWRRLQHCKKLRVHMQHNAVIRLAPNTRLSHSSVEETCNGNPALYENGPDDHLVSCVQAAINLPAWHFTPSSARDPLVVGGISQLNRRAICTACAAAIKSMHRLACLLQSESPSLTIPGHADRPRTC